MYVYMYECMYVCMYVNMQSVPKYDNNVNSISFAVITNNLIIQKIFLVSTVSQDIVIRYYLVTKSTDLLCMILYYDFEINSMYS